MKFSVHMVNQGNTVYNFTVHKTEEAIKQMSNTFIYGSLKTILQIILEATLCRIWIL